MVSSRFQAWRRRHAPMALLGAIFLALTVGLLAAPVGRAGADPVAQPSSFDQTEAARPSDYRIGPLDTLNITVFQVKDLTLDKVQVDASGQILLPLIGTVVAQGKTAMELSQEIATRLSAKYLQSPQVSVVVEDASSQKVTVEGAVVEAGVFSMKGRTSLMEAVAMAKGAAPNANLKKVAIVRTVNGQPHAATFNLAEIYAGQAPNPEIFGNDVVIIGTSRGKDIWDGMVKTLPALAILAYIHP